MAGRNPIAGAGKALVFLSALVFWAFVVLSALVVLEGCEHRRTPNPPGMVLRIVEREVVSPSDRFRVTRARTSEPAIAVEVAGKRFATGTRSIYAYPSGALLERTEFSGHHLDPDEPYTFDFDGDGEIDRVISHDGIGRRQIEVLSGADLTVLYRQRDPLEYEGGDRAIPLGDLDGDGYGELALLHPRMDRSRYDLEPLDRLFGAKSWITVVSGSRVAKR